MSKFKAGDKIVFGRCKRNNQLVDITVGKIYEAVASYGDIFFMDDVGDYFHMDGDCSPGKVTKIVE